MRARKVRTAAPKPAAVRAASRRRPASSTIGRTSYARARLAGSASRSVAWSRAGPRPRATLEEAEVAFRGARPPPPRRRPARRSTPFASSTVDRADLVGPEDAEAAAFDHRRAAHPEVGVADVAMITSLAAGERRVAGEAAARDDRDDRHAARRGARSSRTSARAARRRSGKSTSPGRPPPPSANSTTGSRSSCASSQHAIGLLVAAMALRAGQHGRVVGHHDAARAAAGSSNSAAVDRADAGHDAVGRRVLRSGRRRRGAGSARRPRARRIRRSCRRRRGRRCSRARCAGRARGASRRRRAARRRA